MIIDKYFEEIGHDEYYDNTRYNKSENLSTSEIRKIYSSQSDKLYTIHSFNDSRFILKTLIHLIYVYKYSDEWFYAKVDTEPTFTYFKCDQFEGVEELIKQF